MLARSQRFYYRPEFLHIMFRVHDFFLLVNVFGKGLDLSKYISISFII